MLKLTESQRVIVGDMLQKAELSPYERGQLAAWRIRVNDPDDRALLDRVTAKGAA